MLAHFATIHDRHTPIGLVNRLFLLEEIVFREYEMIKVLPAGPGYFAVATRHQITAGSFNLRELVFSVAGLTVSHKEGDLAVVHAPLAAGAKEVHEEIALAFANEHINFLDHESVRNSAERWEFYRAEEAAADAESDYP